jgi:hypothetical protein
LSQNVPVLPNFLVIGAGKGGTTSLHRWLAQHPQVFVTRLKETNYFAYEASYLMPGAAAPPEGRRLFPVCSWDEYLALFGGAAEFEARGEVSPRYLAWPAVPERIAARLPDVRLVAILRHPVDRAYSSFLMHARDGRERRPFAEAIRQELNGTADPGLAYGQLNYLRLGFYHRHLSGYWGKFAPERLHIELYDDLRTDTRGLLRRVYRFLGVDEGFEPDLSARLNPSGVPRHRLLAPLLRKNRVSRAVRALLPWPLEPRFERAFERWRARQLTKPPLDLALRAELIGRYRDDIRRLGERLERDLSSWLEG